MTSHGNGCGPGCVRCACPGVRLSMFTSVKCQPLPDHPQAPNYSLQQLIQQVAAKKDRTAPRGPLSPTGAGGGEEGMLGADGGGAGNGAALGAGGAPELGGNADR